MRRGIEIDNSGAERAIDLPDRVSAIAAVAANGVIGAAGKMPWDCPADLARFQRVTRGASLIMGRVTFESIGRPLPGRHSIVLTHGADALERDGIEHPPAKDGTPTLETWVGSFGAAFEVARRHPGPVFVIGGAHIYRAAWPYLTDLDITEIHQHPVGDTYFPTIDLDEWSEVSREPHDGFDFVHYLRADVGAL